MAWRSICGKKGRSALTILSIFIGIAAVMTIVSTMEGMKAKTMEQYAAMGANRISVSVYAYTYDENGNSISKDYFTDLYKYCSGLKDYVIGVTPNSQANATVIYGTKSTANMEWQYDDQYNVISGPPTQYYGSACWARRRRGSFSAAPTRWGRYCRSTATALRWWACTPPAWSRIPPLPIRRIT